MRVRRRAGREVGADDPERPELVQGGAVRIRRVVLLVALLLLLAGCFAPESFGVGRPQKPTVKIGSTNFSEQQLLAELYGVALEGAGYRVERQLGLGSRETVEPALESGRMDLYAEYLATLLAFVTGDPGRGSADPSATYQTLQTVLEPRGIAALSYAPAANTNGLVVTRPTAQRYGLAKISDLVPIAERLVLGGPPECPVRPFCLPGLRQTYGITFRAFRIYDAGGPQTVAALESGQIDVALLFTTDPIIAARSFVLLADDRQLQLADNVVPIVRSDLLRKAPSDFRSTLDAVSARLTTEELTRLNAQVSLEREPPRDVARAWLQANGLAR
jgi:osmoprotectant transport system substrate-binding protein